LQLLRAKAKEPVGVRRETRTAKVAMHAEPLGRAQPSAELTLVPRALGAEEQDTLVHWHPVPLRDRLGGEWDTGRAVRLKALGASTVLPVPALSGAVGRRTVLPGVEQGERPA
jgi:hypothetical protein